MAEIEHGKRSTYTHRGCRCQACTVANREGCAEQVAKRFSGRTRVDGRWFHPDAIHGTVSGYRNWGCRCGECTAAHMVTHTAWRKRKAASQEARHG